MTHIDAALVRALLAAGVVPVIGTLGVGNRSERVFTPAETDDLLAVGRSLAARYPQAAAI